MFELQLNLGLTKGILAILAKKKGTLVAPVPERVAPHCFRCSHGPVEKR